MEELVRFIVGELVDNKDSFTVESQVEDGITVINIIAEKEEIGKIIGKQGRNCKGYPYYRESGLRKRQQKKFPSRLSKSND